MSTIHQEICTRCFKRYLALRP